jgi:hypothetical protein
MSGGRPSSLGRLSNSIHSLLRSPETASGSHYLPPNSEYPYHLLDDEPPLRARSPLLDNSQLHGVENNSETLYESSTSNSPPRDAESGVAQIEALHREKQGLSIWWLYASIGAVAFVYSLDQNVTGNYLPIATSAYNRHSILGTINTAESIISASFCSAFPCLLVMEITDAVAKPFIAKIADVTSRPNAYSVTLAFYVLGYLLIAGSTMIEEVVAGMLIYTVGH